MLEVMKDWICKRTEQLIGQQFEESGEIDVEKAMNQAIREATKLARQVHENICEENQQAAREMYGKN